MNDITDKWALVTGASRGIGREVAIALGELGCNLLLHSRSVAHTETLAEEILAVVQQFPGYLNEVVVEVEYQVC